MRVRGKGIPHTLNCQLRCAKIVDIVSRFPLLHAYGVGLDMFRTLPEQDRMRAIDYSKWMLAYALDDEIDSAWVFLNALRCHRHKAKSENFVRCSYVMTMYKHWQTLSGKQVEKMLPGCLIVAALLIGQKVNVVPDLKPDCLISIPWKRRLSFEKLLERNTKFVNPPDEEKFRIVNDDRVDEQGNEPQSVDAVESVNGDDNGIE